MLNRTFILRVGAVALIAATAWAAGPERSAGQSVVVVNGTRTAMIMLQLKESRAPEWQPDLLSRRPLGVQKETVFRRDRNACIFDLKAMFEDGHRITKQRVDLCKAPRYVVADF